MRPWEQNTGWVWSVDMEHLRELYLTYHKSSTRPRNVAQCRILEMNWIDDGYDQGQLSCRLTAGAFSLRVT
jgi:acyl CoA:acetate/3-ketoacid CoA transferase alpha subunit